MSSIQRLVFFEPADKTTQPSKGSCSSGSTYAKLGDRRSHKSTCFLETIWLMSLAGIGEMPGPVTNNWCRIGAESNNVESEETSGSAEANEALVLNDTRDWLGGAKVSTKEGKTKAGLPGREDAVSEEECNGRLDPVPKRNDVCGPKAWLSVSEEIATER